VTANDIDPGGPTDDADTGPNNLQNFPAITETTFSESNGFTNIWGTLDSTPNQTFIIELFHLSEFEPSSYGEGELLIGRFNVTTDANGRAYFFTQELIDRGELTATATNAATGDTSEFSENVPIPPGGENGAKTRKSPRSLHGGSGAVVSGEGPRSCGRGPLRLRR
jgi:hypothetical protein